MRGYYLVLSLVLFISIFLSGSVYAACPESQRIMRLSSQTNAHGEVYNGVGNYPIEICYPNIFGSSYIGSNPHSCTGNNKIVNLSASTNAHAEKPSLTNYPVSVCYGDLQCVARSSCQANERLIVSLSADTNAHLSNSPDYAVKICCKSATGAITGAYWSNMIDEPISQADLNDRVKLNIAGQNLAGEINFTIYEDVAFWFNKKIISSLTYGFTTWRANETGDFYFKAVASDGSGSELTSGILSVSDPEENSPPVAIITSPHSGGIYFVNENVGFTQASYDEDDFINSTWYYNNIAFSSETNTTFSFSADGQKNIKLKVKDERGLADYDYTSILVIRRGKYVYAEISEPEWGQIFENNFAFFNASESYAIDVIENGIITCLIGSCPLTTFNGTPVENSPKPITNEMQFYWEFSDDKQNNWQTKLTPFQQNGTGGMAFTRFFGKTGEKWVRLTASVNPSSSAEAEFVTGGGYCTNSGTTWIAETDEFNTLTTGACGEYLGAISCCPLGYSCRNFTEGEAGEKRCQAKPDYCSYMAVCSNYTTQADCENDVCELGLEGGIEWNLEAEGMPSCGDESDNFVTDCLEGCSWDNDKCIFDRTFMEIIGGEGDNCKRNTIVGSCIGGIRPISWTETGGESCIDSGSTNYPCGEKKLGFFGVFQFIGVLLSIILFYYFIRDKAKDK